MVNCKHFFTRHDVLALIAMLCYIINTASSYDEITFLRRVWMKKKNKRETDERYSNHTERSHTTFPS